MIWVKREKKNCSSLLLLLACSNQDLAFSECTCRLQISASHTFASRKFNVFIHLFVGEIDLGTVRDDERELHSFLARPPRLKKDAVNAGENQFAHRASVGGSLGF